MGSTVRILLSTWLLIEVYTLDIMPSGMGVTPDTYGPYQINYSQHELCKGPKAKDLTITDCRLEKTGCCYIANFYQVFMEPTRFEDVKIVIYAFKNKRKTVLWNYRVKNPCQHYVISGVIEQNFHTTSNCIAKKGNYSFEINYTELSKQFFGTSFFYGEYFMKSAVLSSKGNIICVLVKVDVLKK